MVGSNNIIGENIRKAREKAGKTQTDLAIQLHRLKVKIDRSKIAKIEIGAKSISDIETIAVAEALKISVESLFEGSELKFKQRIEHLK
jgi:transcriptional regulator with XRE-family HTH domain